MLSERNLVGRKNTAYHTLIPSIHKSNLLELAPEFNQYVLVHLRATEKRLLHMHVIRAWFAAHYASY